MIYGVGTDIIEISRIASAIEKSGFLERSFTEKERNYNSKRVESAAANFAAKEAFAKALGTGFRGFSLTDVELLHDSFGKPYIEVYGNAKTLLAERKVHISLSHCREYASAFVVIEN